MFTMLRVHEILRFALDDKRVILLVRIFAKFSKDTEG